MRLSFHGADQGVTGSCHQVECAGKKVLRFCDHPAGKYEFMNLSIPANIWQYSFNATSLTQENPNE